MIFLLCVSVKGYAQYSFEKYPAIKYKKLVFDKSNSETDSSITAKTSYLDYNITLTQKEESDTAHVVITYKRKIISDFTIGADYVMALQDTAYVADIDGNGFPDFKILYYNMGSGLASSLEHKLYCFNEGNKRFNKFFYIDFFNFAERDINGDGNYEIISDILNQYKGHSYWTFNLFNYRGGKFINVNKIADYPIMVPYRYDETFEITKKISRLKMKKFSVDFPDYFKHN
jgi:hypothetical protein